MSILEISQIIFNIIVSFAVVVVTVLISIITYNIIKFSKAVNNFVDGVNKESIELFGKINGFLKSIFNLSFISKFFRKK